MRILLLEDDSRIARDITATLAAAGSRLTIMRIPNTTEGVCAMFGLKP